MLGLSVPLTNPLPTPHKKKKELSIMYRWSKCKALYTEMQYPNRFMPIIVMCLGIKVVCALASKKQYKETVNMPMIVVPSYSAGFFLQKRWLSFVWFWNKWAASWSLVRLQNWTFWWWDYQNPNGWDLCQMFESVCKCWHSFVWSFQTTKLPVTSGTFRKPYWYYWGIIYCWRHFCLNIKYFIQHIFPG